MVINYKTSIYGLTLSVVLDNDLKTSSNVVVHITFINLKY